MMSEYSYFHVSKITLQEAQPSVDKLYSVAAEHRKLLKSEQVQLSEESTAVKNEVDLHTSECGWCIV